MAAFDAALDRLNATIRDTFATSNNGTTTETIVFRQRVGGAIIPLKGAAQDPLRLQDTAPSNFTLRWFVLSDFGLTPPVAGDLVDITIGLVTTRYVIDQALVDAGKGVQLFMSRG